jgi:hemerythrin superfamily protein
MADSNDVVELLKSDHRAVDRLLGKLESDGTPDGEKRRLLDEVTAQLAAHSKGEEDVVYPHIRQSVPKEEDEVKDGVAEHHHIEQLLTELAALAPDDPGADGKVAAMAAEVRHHVEEEEQDIFPAYTKATSAQERAAIGARFLERKNAELTARGYAPAAATAQTSDRLIDLTRDELYERAKRAGVEGRSSMTKDELVKALGGR